MKHGFMIRKMLLEEVLPGMELGTEILLSGTGRRLEEGTALTSDLIGQLKKIGVVSIDVRQREEWDDFLKDASDESGEKKRFFTMYTHTVQHIKQTFDAIRAGEILPIDEMEKMVQEMILPMLDYRGIIHNLYELQTSDEYTFHHSVKVSLLCSVIGKWLGYSDDQVRQVSLAGLLHDVGKARIPIEMLTKPGKLSEAEMAVVRRHVSKGYELLSESGAVVEWPIVCGMLQHHERMDGSGYPHGAGAEDIHVYARIVAVADVYDAMTSDRVYRKKHTPFMVLKLLTEEMFDKLDPDVCTTFMNNIRDYFIGNKVRLSDGRFAEVVALHQPLATRPVVRTQDGCFIDLEGEKGIVIVEFIAN